MDDPLVGDVSVIESAPVLVDGLTVDGHAIDALRGSLDIGLQEGRLPRTPDEITLGLRAAQDLDVGAGDTVTSRQPGGRTSASSPWSASGWSRPSTARSSASTRS